MNLLEVHEVRALLDSLARSRGPEGFSPEEARQVLEWGEDASMEATLFDLVLRGQALVTINEGEIAFAACDQADEMQPTAVAQEVMNFLEEDDDEEAKPDLSAFEALDLDLDPDPDPEV